MKLPDAPWIRDAEDHGVDGYDGPAPRCPICGSDTCDQVYVNRYGDPVGCENCLKRWDIWLWAEKNGGDGW